MAMDSLCSLSLLVRDTNSPPVIYELTGWILRLKRTIFWGKFSSYKVEKSSQKAVSDSSTLLLFNTLAQLRFLRWVRNLMILVGLKSLTAFCGPTVLFLFAGRNVKFGKWSLMSEIMVPDDEVLSGSFVIMWSMAECAMPCMRVDLVIVCKKPLLMMVFRYSVQYGVVCRL